MVDIPKPLVTTPDDFDTIFDIHQSEPLNPRDIEIAASFFETYLADNFRQGMRMEESGTLVSKWLVDIFSEIRDLPHMYFMLQTLHRVALCNYPDVEFKLRQIKDFVYTIPNMGQQKFPGIYVLLGIHIYLSNICVETFAINHRKRGLDMETSMHSSYLASQYGLDPARCVRNPRTGLPLYPGPEAIDYEIAAILFNYELTAEAYNMHNLIGTSVQFGLQPDAAIYEVRPDIAASVKFALSEIIPKLEKYYHLPSDLFQLDMLLNEDWEG